MNTKAFLITLMVLVHGVTSAQQKKSSATTAVKKPLTHSVYDGWKEITFRALTPDGTAAVFTVNPQDGDGKVVFYNLKTNTQDSVSRAADIRLGWDSRQAVFKIKPPQKLVKDLRRQKKKKDELPKDSLGIYSFASRKVEKIPEVKSYGMPLKAGGWLAYQLEAAKEEKPKANDTTKKTETPKAKKVKKNSDDNGYTLVLRKLADQKETRFEFVKEYLFAKYGQGLLFTSTGNDSTVKAGVYWYDLATENLRLLYTGKSKYGMKGLAISEEGTQAAFLIDPDTTKAQVRHVELFHWKKGEETARQLDAEHSKALPINWLISEHYTPQFSKDGSRLFFGSCPVPVVADTTLLPEEIVNVEVWTGNDDYIYPQQNRQLETEKKRSYLAVIDLASRTISQLASSEQPTLELGDEGNASIVLAETDKPYRKMGTWDLSVYSDLHVLDLKTNQQKMIAKKIKGNASLSPKANYVFWFSLPDTAWYAYAVATEKTVKLTEGVAVKFADEEVDVPDYPGAYGTAGWTANDAQVLVYDRYDIWSLDPENKRPPVNLTAIGRKEKTTFRYLRLDPEERFIDPANDMLLSAFNETTRQAGYYKLNLSTGKLTRLLLTDHRYTGTVKALQANIILFSRQTFREFPDVWATDMNFTASRKLSEANPQMKNYLWGSVETVYWTSADNIPLRGLLYKPDNFDPTKKYPMIVYFYEKNSDMLHAHWAPSPIRSILNFTLFTSNGYVVFVPDVVYRVGFPGESAMNCIMPGVTSLMAKGFVDEKRIGIQGHSWGGYQIAYMVTRTNLFRAAEAGAPVSNMISAYGGVRWESGLSRMFQYEHSQSRIGGTLWEKPMHYIENSPIFFADKVQTPLLMMHNDADGAVPWYQGIEYYMALRRLNKPVWMLNYNGQGHGLSQRQDRTDFAIRMMQFFDHYLKDAPMPSWMTRGVPAIEKGIRQGLE